MMWGYGFGWGWWLMPVVMLPCIALVVILVWAAIRWLGSKTTASSLYMTTTQPGGPSALEILQQRYARGEIDTATFEQMRERLVASGAHDRQPTRENG